jgi:hypothetical protein
LTWDYASAKDGRAVAGRKDYRGRPHLTPSRASDQWRNFCPRREKKEGTGHWKGGGTPCAASLLLWMEKRRGGEERLRQEKGRSGSIVYYASILEIDRDWDSFAWPID